MNYLLSSFLSRAESLVEISDLISSTLKALKWKKRADISIRNLVSVNHVERLNIGNGSS